MSGPQYLVKAAHAFVLTILPFCFLSPAFASSPPPLAPRFSHISLEQGLSQSVIRAMLQTRDGYLWLGTEAGLNRYDGYQFTVFSHDPANVESLSSSNITALYEDRQGRLWVGSANGLNRRQDSGTSFTRYPLQGETVRAIAESSNGTVWVSTDYALYRFQNDAFTRFRYAPNDAQHERMLLTSLWVHDDRAWVGSRVGLLEADEDHQQLVISAQLPLTPGTNEANIFVIRADQSGNLWLGTSAGLFKFQTQARQLTAITLPGKKVPTQINHLLVDTENLLWLGSKDGVYRYDGKSLQPFLAAEEVGGLSRVRVDLFSASLQYRADLKQFMPYAQSEEALYHANPVTDLFRDSTGTLWVATATGLGIWSDKEGRFHFYQHNPLDPHSLSSSSGTDGYRFYEDHSGAIWISAALAGLNKFVRSAQKFRHYRNHHAGFLDTQSVRALHETDNGRTVWAGFSESGLKKFLLDGDGRIRDIVHYRHLAGSDKGPADNFVTVFADALDGGLWVGSIAGLDYYDPRTDRFRYLPYQPPLAHGLLLQAIYQQDADTLWVGTWAGLARVSGLNAKPELEWFFHQPEDVASLPSNKIERIVPGSDGQLLIGTTEGLCIFDRASKRCQRVFRHDVTTSNGLGHNWIYSIAEQPEGTLWVGTPAGLHRLRLDQADAEWKRYGKKHGLADDYIYDIAVDQEGLLWLSSNRGIMKFDPSTEHVRNFRLDEGLQHYEFNQGTGHRGHSGTLYFGGIQGFNAFRPEHTRDNPVPPKLHITGVSVNDQPLALNQMTEHLVLPHHRNYLSFSFTALHFANPIANRYAYRLEGVDDNWIYSQERRVVRYPNLAPGDYVLRVRAANSDGVWNAEEQSLAVTIQPPCWYVFNQARRRRELEQLVAERTTQLAEQSQQLQQALTTKNLLFANISHEFRTPLTLILGPVAQLQRQLSEPSAQESLQAVLHYGRRLLRMVDQLLGLASSAFEQSAKPTSVPLQPVLRLLTDAFSGLSAAKQQQLQLTLDGSLWVLVDQGQFEQMLINLLSNAIKYTPKGGQISVHAEAIGEEVAVHVIDSGPGIDPAQHATVFERFFRLESAEQSEIHGTGLGLALVKQLVQANRGRITLDSTPGQGSRFSLWLPRATPTTNSATVLRQRESLTLEAQLLGERATDSAAMETSNPFDRRRLPTVLLIEDSADMRAYIGSLLERDYRVLHASDGEMGIKLAVEHLPDLILTDLMMPKQDGYAVLDTLRQHAHTCHIPIIVLTAKSDEDSRLRGLQAKANDYLVKPFNQDELLLKIANTLEARELLQQRIARELAQGSMPNEGISDAERRFLTHLEQVVSTHFHDNEFKLTELAKALAMTERQLQRKLKASTGQTPSEYLSDYRLRQAAAMLLSHSAPLGRIAEDCGFATQAHFSSCFAAKYGISPSRFRKQHKQATE